MGLRVAACDGRRWFDQFGGKALEYPHTYYTLQPTALVHEAYARLAQRSELQLKNRVHFMAVASQFDEADSDDHARARVAAKRGGVQRQVTLDDGLFTAESHALDVLILDEALTRLTRLNARHARIVELHFFGGCRLRTLPRPSAFHSGR
jgi:RNA polymerase sigma factor (TIGR02999 family)